MRSIGAAERALELLCQRALTRTTFGKRIAERSNIMDWIAEARIELEMVRLLTLKTAWLMDTAGNKAAAVEITRHQGGRAQRGAARSSTGPSRSTAPAAMSDDFPLAAMYAHLRTLRLADGPDEVHKMTIARRELRRHDPDFPRVMTAEAVAAVRLAVDEVKEVLTSLTPEEWDRPSGCAGWRVQDLVAHMSSNWKEVVDPTPPPPDPPQLPAEALMELLVDPRRGWSADEVLAEYLAYCDPAVDALAALQAEPLASVEQRLADLGTYPLHLLADAFAFDHYCHLRIDLLAPHGPVERAVPAADAVRLAPAIGWMLAGMPQMQPDLAAHVDPAGPLRLTLTGPGGGSWMLVSGDGVLRIDPADGGGDGREVATITSDGHAFVRWATQRSPWREDCAVAGDEAAAARFLDVLNVV